MTGTVGVFIPRDSNGDLLTGWCGKAHPYPRSVETRAFFDPDADRNGRSAIPISDPRHPLNPERLRKAKPLPTVAPRGWRLRPIEPLVEQRVETRDKPTCQRCGRSFRKLGGLAWHVERCGVAVTA